MLDKDRKRGKLKEFIASRAKIWKKITISWL